MFSVRGPCREDMREYRNRNSLHLSSEVPREQQWPEGELEDLVCDVTCAIVTGIWRVYELIVFTTSEDPISRFTNPNPRLSHCDT
jgi:hypothetical protein